MDKATAFQLLLEKLPPLSPGFAAAFEARCELMILERNELLVRFQSSARKMYFLLSGSLIRNIMTSKGKEKTVLFHTESFLDILKCHDAVHLNITTVYEIIANERSVVVAIDYDFLLQNSLNDLTLAGFYLKKTEEALLMLNLFRNFHLGLTSEEYLKWLHENHAFLFQRFPAQNIASFMGITNVWLSKLKSKMIV
jgi:hypothetical protein